jgi:hypothetical protein
MADAELENGGAAGRFGFIKPPVGEWVVSAQSIGNPNGFGLDSARKVSRFAPLRRRILLSTRQPTCVCCGCRIGGNGNSLWWSL